jgi:hypothetical protein
MEKTCNVATKMATEQEVVYFFITEVFLECVDNKESAEIVGKEKYNFRLLVDDARILELLVKQEQEQEKSKVVKMG